MYLIGFKGVGDLWQLGQFIPPAILFNVALCYSDVTQGQIQRGPQGPWAPPDHQK